MHADIPKHLSLSETKGMYCRLSDARTKEFAKT